MLAREWRGFWPLRTASNTVISRTRRAKSLNNNRSGVTQVNWHRANDTWQLHRLPMFRANDRAETIFATAILLRATWSTSNQLLVCLASSFSLKIICRTRWKGTSGCLSIFRSRFLGNSDQQASISRSDGFICYYIFLFSFVFFLSFFPFLFNRSISFIIYHLFDYKSRNKWRNIFAVIGAFSFYSTPQCTLYIQNSWLS